MRGKGGSCLQQGALSRITPAYAGKSYLADTLRSQRQDHPRLCGEKDSQLLRRNDLKGSPPPMRGKASLHGSIPLR